MPRVPRASQTEGSLRRLGLLGIVLSSLVASLVLFGSPAQAASTASAITAHVSATTGWQDSGVALQTGQKYTSSYVSGTWTVDYRNFSYVGPGGYSIQEDSRIYQGCKFDAGLEYGVLLGKVGTGPWFIIGKGGTTTAKQNGHLFLRIHDGDACLGDNAGSVNMAIEPVPVSAPAPTPPVPAPVPTPEQCPAVYFIGVRGSGEKPGFGDTIRPHEEQLAHLVTARFGSSAFYAVALDYPATSVTNYWLALYDYSWRTGIKALTDQLTSQYNACQATKEIFVLAGYSQGAMVTNSALQVLAASASGKDILARVANVTLYSDPRRQDAGGKLSWEVGESSSLYQGAAGFAWYATAMKAGYPPFTTDPLGSPSRLVSYCNGPDKQGDPADPICATPRKDTIEQATDLLQNHHQTHLTYVKTYVPTGASLAASDIRRAICGSLVC
jgi:hypothetical protein